MIRPTFGGFAAALTLLIASNCSAAKIYVSNVEGHAGNNGLSPTYESDRVGPISSIHLALRRAHATDTVHVINTGLPYYESISVVGADNSGYPTAPFVIEGNGAVVSGAQLVPRRAFKTVLPEVFRLSPHRKGYYQLLRNGVLVPEVTGITDIEGLDKLERGQWTAFRGQMYYRSMKRELIEDQNYGIAKQTVGLTLHKVQNVVIRNLHFQHFQLDGVNAHDLVRSVTLENVSSHQNARSGVSVNGSCRLKIVDSVVAGNRIDAIRVSERGTLELENCEVDAPVSVIEKGERIGD